jgi:hypothetical protein
MQSNIANSMGSDLTTKQRISVNLQTQQDAVFFSGKVKQGVNHD